jgi:hypothetical protein
MENIIIKYKLNNEEKWRIIDIPPEEYFDLEEDEIVEVDCVPMYLDPIDYIDENPERITNTKAIIVDEDCGKKIIMTTTYWNNHKNSIAEVMKFDKATKEKMDFDNDCYYYELILDKQLQDDPLVYEIIRITKKGDSLIPVYHSITKMVDGFEVDNNIDTSHKSLDLRCHEKVHLENNGDIDLKRRKINVLIKYKLDNDNKWKTFNITPEKYFDLDKNKIADIDTIPKFSKAIDYIGEVPKSITETKIIITDDNCGKKLIVTTTYWDNHRYYMTEIMKFDKFIIQKTDFDNNCYYYEVIYYKQIQDEPLVDEIIKIRKNGDVLIPVFHNIITKDALNNYTDFFNLPL